MDALLQWINEPGLIRWAVDIVALPLVAVLLSLTAVTMIWRYRLEDLAGRTQASVEQREVLVDWLGGAVIAMVILLLLGISRAFSYAVARLEAWREARKGVRLQGTVLITPLRVRHLAVLGMRIVRFVLTLALFYFYVPLLLSFIPATRPLAGHVMPVLIEPARDVGLSVVGYLPRLVSVILIIIAVHYFLRFLTFIMEAVGKEEIRIPGFDSEWADQTARPLKIVMILGTIMLIYPFLPGAGSQVFKGFSLFVGAMFTFGASSSVSNVISGVILTYTRSFRIGDRILDEPEPTVLQKSLGEFAVEYELLATTDDPQLMVRTRSVLHQNVLDQFNQAGVEIMTPNVNAVRNSVEPAIPESYVTDTRQPVLHFLGLQGGAP